MEDLVSLLIFGAIFFFSLLAGKKRKAQGQPPSARRTPRAVARPSPRPRPAPTRPAPEARWEPEPKPVRQQPTAGGEPQELMEGLLDLLRGRVPIEVQAPEPLSPKAEIDDEARSLEEKPDRVREHQEFHDKYVVDSVPATVTPRPRSRYRLTPKTAKEAVVWTAIFTRPKGLE